MFRPLPDLASRVSTKRALINVVIGVFLLGIQLGRLLPHADVFDAPYLVINILCLAEVLIYGPVMLERIRESTPPARPAGKV